MKSIARWLRGCAFALAATSLMAQGASAQASVRILPLGDSLTEGVTDNSVQGGYRNRLYSLLTTAGYNVDFVGTFSDPANPGLPDVNHQGLGGSRIDQIHAALPDWLKAVEDPDVVLLMIGTNDFSANYQIASVQTRLSNLIADIAQRRPFAKILVASPPARFDSAALDSQQASYSAAIPGIVTQQAALGRQVGFVDIRSLLAVTDMTSDGVHAKTTGYNKMADAWFSAVSAVVSPQGNTNPPVISRVGPIDDRTKVPVVFSKPVSDSSANTANFSISGGLAVTGAVLDSSKRVITLTTSQQTPGIVYELTVNGVRDRTPLQTLIAPQSKASFSSSAIVNGGFENNHAGWTQTGNQEIKSLPENQPSEGSRLVAFNTGQSTPNGTLAQTFATTVGQAYELSFDLGVYGYATDIQQLQVIVAGSGDLVSDTATIQGVGGGGTKWIPKSYTFVANSSSATLTFTDTSPTSLSTDVLLDNVRITAASSRSLAVTSSPASGVNLIVNPADRSGNSGGASGIIRYYNDGTTVTVTAPASANGAGFLKWQKNGVDVPGSTTNISITMDRNHSLNAVYGSNGAPVAVNDSYSTVTGRPLVVPAIGVLTNDSDADGGPLTAVLVTGPAHGTVTLSPSGSFTYTPAAGYSGPDSFTYRANDGSQNSNIATVSLTVISGSSGGIVNGSFEDGTNGWNITGSRRIINQDASYTATDGNILLVANGGQEPPNVIISQSFATTPGQTYMLDFDMGVIGMAGLVQQWQISVTGNGPLLARTEAITATGSPSAHWEPRSFSFVADSAQAFLEFVDVSATGDSVDLLLDNVRITPAGQPVPSSFINGSFESGFTGWTASGSPETVKVNSVIPARDGVSLVEFNSANSPNDGVLSQTFATTAGTTYRVSFQMGVLAYGGSPQVLEVSATGSVPLTTRSFSLTGNPSIRWADQSFEFTANSPSTTLTFADRSTSTFAIDLLLDDVRVVATNTGTVQRTLTVATSGATSVAIVVSPADVGGNASGTAGFSRTYPDGTPVTLTAPSISSGATFSKWQKNGVDLTISPTATVTMDGNHTLTAVYTAGPPVQTNFVNGSFESGFTGWVYSGSPETVKVNSAMPARDGVSLVEFNSSNSPNDGVLSQTFTTTAGTTYSVSFQMGVLAYNSNPQVLEVSVTGSGPLTSRSFSLTGNPGIRWETQSFEFTANSAATTLTFADRSTSTIAIDLLLDDVKVIPSNTGTVQRTLSVAASGASSVSVSASPADVGGNAGGVTGFSRIYPDGTLVTLTAPAVSGGATFTKWQKNGEDLTISPIATVTMDGNHALTAVYTAGPPAQTSFVNGSFESGFTGWGYSGSPQTVNINSVMPARDGVSLVEFNSSNSPNDGVLSQTFATTAGTTYNVSFQMGVLAYSGSPQVMEVSVTGSGPLTTRSFSLTGNPSIRWATQSFEFTANSAATTLTFADRSTSTIAIDLLLDDVRVTIANAGANQRTLTVAASGATSVAIAATPADVNGNTGGTTGFSRIYAEGTEVTLTAPAVSAGATFTKWQRNGADLTTNASTTVTMNADYTFTAVYSPAPPVNTNLVNGSFEDGTNGWSIIGSRRIITQDASYTATDGNILVVANGGQEPPNVVISQTFATTPGQTYVLDFDMGVIGAPGLPQQWRISVTGTAALLSRTEVISSTGSSAARWEPRSFSFVADSTQATLEFVDVSVNGDGVDLLLDNVRVAPAGQPVLTNFINGSFESGFTGWTPSGSPETVKVNSVLPARDGVSLVEFNSSNSPNDGVLRQTFATTAGTTYSVSFQMGVLSYTGSTQVLEVSATGSGPLTTRSFSMTGNPSIRWATQTFEFTANSSSTTLVFADRSTSTFAIDLLLDDVKVTAANTGTTQRTLTVAASGATSVAISASPADVNGATGGTTGFSRSYPDGTLVTLTAPAVSSGATFSKWQKNGADLTISPSATVTMDGNHTLTAVYIAGPPVQTNFVNGSFESGFTGWGYSGSPETVKVNSTMPARDGVSLVEFNSSNSPNDGVLSQTFATTAGTTYNVSFQMGVLSYNSNPQVLEVSATGSGPLATRSFSLTGDPGIRWATQSFEFTANSAATTLTFADRSTATIAIDLLLDDVKVTASTGAVQRTLAVASSGATSVAVSVSPADVNGATGGATGFSRTYPDGTPVTLTAPAVSGGNVFTKWQRNGEDLTNSTTATVTMDGNHTLTAVYTAGPPVQTNFVNGSFESGLTGWGFSGSPETVKVNSSMPARDGVSLVEFNSGNSPTDGVLSQTFATTVGTSYDVTFEMGVLSFTGGPQVVEVSAAGTTRTFSLNGNSNGVIRWATQTISFTATDSQTTLTFRDRSASTVAIDLLLDHVRVTAAAPSPVPAPAGAQTPTGEITDVGGEPALPPAPLIGGTPGDIRIGLPFAPAGTYVLERSADLRKWTPHSEIQLAEPGPVEFTDSETGGQSMFYRIGMQPAPTGE